VSYGNNQLTPRTTLRNKNKVYESYNKIAEWFDEHRSRDLFEKPHLDKAIEYLNPHADILDVGCGMGEPIAQYFIEQGFSLTGIDGSEGLISLAKIRFPKNTFLISDMRTLNLNKKFDCIIAWNSLFHLSQEDQRKMFIIFEKHLHYNGILLFTSGPEAGEIWGDNGGEELYHASLSPAEYEKILIEHNFEPLSYSEEEEQSHTKLDWSARLHTHDCKICSARS